MTIDEIYADVTIVGAGPTGLSVAILLRQLGHSVFIAEKAPTSLPVGRADALNARSQQTLEVLGVLDQLEPKGLKCNTSSTFSDGQFVSRQNAWWVALKNCARPNFLMIGQSDVEAALHTLLDTPCHHSHEALGIEEVAEGGEVFVLTRFADKVVRSRYAVGADGAKSLVRNALGIPFEGEKPNMVWHVLDTFIDTDFPVCPEIITFQVGGQARIAWIPRERGMARFYTLLEDNSIAEQPRIEEEIRKFLAPHRVDFLRTEWFSIFEVKERVARTYFSPHKRITLAGDAAHIHSVNGGQGLNTGLADAFALAWRLSLALKGHATDAVWQSYETERRTCAVGVIDVAAKLVRSTLRTAEEYVGLIEKNAGYITGMGVTYPEGATALVAGAVHGIFVPGHRMPDVFLHESPEDVDGRRLYSVLQGKYGKFVVLAFGDNASIDSHEGTKWTAFVETWDVSGNPGSGSPKNFSRISNVPDRSPIDAGSAAFVVIRPDMYVGYVGEDVGGYLDKVFS
ncbi:putative monooxygenase [Auricularia subglabra TFB-10046 SS5]|nr:putative monooxygenase [Auricularia subglabra TFB-10046 SS5]